MEGSRLLAWIALASFVVALGSLLRARFRPEEDDAHSRDMTELTATLAAGATLGPIPRLFGLEGGLLHWIIDGLLAVITVLLWVQLFRLRSPKDGDAVQR